MFRASPEKIRAIVENLRQKADELGLPFGPRTKTYNSRQAQELGLWAEEKGCGKSFHHAAFTAYFVDGLNLAKNSVLLDLAEKAGLSRDEAQTVLAEKTYAPRVDRDWQESQLQGITAVPTFVMGRHKLVGAQNFETLAELVQYYGAIPRQQ